MKYILHLFISTFLLFSCQDSVRKNDDIKVSTKSIKKTENIKVEEQKVNQKATGSYIERFPNGKLKIEGWRNSSSQRDGIWYSYYENGNKWSELSYKNGVKNGISIVYHPNGNVHYKGQYKNDVKSGNWTFYKESGEIESEKNFD